MLGTGPSKDAMRVSVWAMLVLIFGLGLMVSALPGLAGAGESDASIARGGRLYNNWYKEIRKAPPQSRHPAYPAAGAVKGSQTWRCKECHGWDYEGSTGAYASGRHVTGIKGIRQMAGADPKNIVAVIKDNTHAYTDLDLLDDADFLDLANFVAKGQFDMNRYIDRRSLKANGDATRNRAYYQTICANCHGRDGLKIRTIPPLGKVATENPWEALHNILNGHPNVEMPPLRGLDNMQSLVDVLAYMQTFPTDEKLWSIVRGGRLYDNWYKELDVAAPSVSHPAYPSAKVYAAAPKANWRCKECHGWDYMGKNGAYSSGRHYTGIKGIRGMAGVDPATIVAVFKDATHRYRGAFDNRATMTDGDLQDLANFVAEGQIEMDRYIDRQTKKAIGDARKRKDFYATICANCHGIDGRKISPQRPLGDVARGNPWETLHNLLNGHPGVKMPPLRVLDDSQTLVDILAYIQTMPGR